MLFALAILACQPGVDSTDSAASGPPDVCLDSPSVDFGVVELGRYAEVGFHVGNCGDGVLDISAVTLAGSPAFSLGGDPDRGAAGLSIPAHAAYLLRIRYTPVEPTGDTGTLSIESNDPDEPTFVVTLTGNR